MRLFQSPVHAQAWYDFQIRMITIPGSVLGLLPWLWLLAIVVGAISQDLGAGLSFAVGGVLVAAIVQIIPASLLPFLPLLGQRINQDVLTGEHITNRNPLPLGMSSYLFSLPMSDRQRAHAILRSSAGSCGIASAMILLSLAVVFGLSWGLEADLLKGDGKGPTKLDTIVPWSMVVVSGGSLLLSFVFATLVFTVDFRKWKLRDWITPLILFAVLMASFTPIALSLSMGLCAIAAGFVVYATVQAVLREDISWMGASLVWLAGMACAAGLFLGIPNEMRSQGLVLGSTLIFLAMLPFFTMVSAIRDLRTT